MTVREHLKKAHEAMAAHHSTMSKVHTAAMSKSADHEQEFHRAAAAAHDDAAESHMSMLEACAKAAADDLSKIQPLPHGFSRVAPDNPTLPIRAIPRFGAPPLQKAVVDEEFAHLISSGDDRTE